MKYVYVPVWTCPSPVIPQKEVLQTVKLKDDADTDSILKAFIYDISYLNNYSDQLISILNGYKKQEVSIFSNGQLPKP